MTNLIDEIFNLVNSKTNFKKSKINKINLYFFNHKASFKKEKIKT